MDYGLKISKPGFDVFTAAAKDLAFGSQYDTLKVYASGTGDFTSDFSTNQVDTISHGLSYRPAFVVYSEIHAGFGEPSTGLFYALPHSPPFGIGGSLVTQTIIAGVDASNLYIRLGAEVVLSGRVINYKYVIFLNPALGDDL